MPCTCVRRELGRSFPCCCKIAPSAKFKVSGSCKLQHMVNYLSLVASSSSSSSPPFERSIRYLRTPGDMDLDGDPLRVPLPASPAGTNEYGVPSGRGAYNGKSPPPAVLGTPPGTQDSVTPPSGRTTTKTGPTDSPWSCEFAEALAKVRSREPERRQTAVQAIKRWEDLKCIRFLNEYYDQGSIDERRYSILYRMCQMIWAIGHEVEIRKDVKLPRAERLAKLKHYCECVLKGARLFMSNMKARSWRVWTIATSIPQLKGIAWQDVEPKMYRWIEEIG